MGNDAVPYSTAIHANATAAVPDANDDGTKKVGPAKRKATHAERRWLVTNSS